MSDYSPEDGYHPPPTEAEWEVFLKRSDARSAKYGELLETLIDHPDRDDIIQREMGWGSDDADGFTQEFEETLDFDDTESPSDSLSDLFSSEANELNDLHADEPFSFEESPLYRRAFEWGVQLHTQLQPYLPKEANSDLDIENPLFLAFSECLVPAAKLAGSQAMSVDDDSLGGSIVYTRRALKATQETLAGLEELRGQHIIPAAELADWIAETQAICAAIAQRIEELRARVWWD